MGFVSRLAYLGLVACCCSSWTKSLVFAKVDPLRSITSCATNVIQSSVDQNGTNLLDKSWLQVQPGDLLVLELNYYCAKSSSSHQGANGPLFDVIRVETNGSQPIENICLSEEQTKTHAELTFEGRLEPYRIIAVNTGSSQHVCVLHEYSTRIRRMTDNEFLGISAVQHTLRDSSRFDKKCGDNQVRCCRGCECEGFCQQRGDESKDIVCKECTTPAPTPEMVNCTGDADCYDFGPMTSECGPNSCQCRRNCIFVNGLCVRDYSTDYELAVKIALVAAIIIAVGILLAILYNTVRERTLRNTTDSPFTRQRNVRRSLDSLQRLVEGLLLDRPPPYSISNDKPPTYDEATREVQLSTDNHGNTTSNNDNTAIATVPNPELSTNPPPYSLPPYVNPAFEAEETDHPPEEDAFAILRIPPRVPTATAPSTSVTIEMQTDSCSHL